MNNVFAVKMLGQKLHSKERMARKFSSSTSHAENLSYSEHRNVEFHILSEKLYQQYEVTEL